MKLLLTLYFEFFKTGLFSVGGGLATIPFLKETGERMGWYTAEELMNMLAVSESTPGPIGINMATYAGFTVAGIPGALAATLGEITPSVIVILIVAAFLKRFRDSRLVGRVFYGLRPASAGLICAALFSVILKVMTNIRELSPEDTWYQVFVPGDGFPVSLPKLIMALVLLFLTNRVGWIRKLHPLFIILSGAAVGMIFHFGSL